ncbi:MAG: hypothetical protein AB7O04_02120 [Hyphomonadaceae bacterium]
MATIETPAERGEGKLPALAAYGLYLLSIPSAAIFALAGVIVAYASRGGAGALARTHLDDQIRIFWVAAFWNIGLLVAMAVAWMLTIVLIGFPLLWLLGLIWFIVMVWFTVKSFFGLLKLLNDSPVRP